MAATTRNEMSMQPGVKIVAAAVVLLVGLGLAMMFRHPAPEFRPTPGPEHLVLHQQGEPVVAPEVPWPPGPAATGARAAREEPAGERPTVLAPRIPTAPPPSLARQYPTASDNTSRWGTSRGMSMEMLLPRPAESVTSHRHVIVDGDTLPDLARRYLGSADRYLEIYEANREALSGGPDLLPIGTVLVIPAR